MLRDIHLLVQDTLQATIKNTCDHNIINFHIIYSSLVDCHCFSDIFSVMNIVILCTGHCIVHIHSTSVWTDVNYSEKCEMF